MPRVRVLLLLACAGGAAAAAAAVPRADRLELRARDAASGEPVRAEVRLEAALGGDRAAVRLDAAGRRLLELAPGGWRVRVEAEGYRPQRATLELAGDSTWVFELDPVGSDVRLRRNAEPQPAVSVWTGVVRAGESGAPLAGVELTTDAGASAATGEDGAFELVLPSAEIELGAPATFALEARAAGRRTLRLERLLPVEGVTRLPLRLELGTGTVVREEAHRLFGDLRPPAPPAGELGAGGSSELPKGVEGADRSAGPAASPLGELEPPAVVRVGFADAGCSVPCCTGACTTTCVLSLETYVARGLNDEWISSWNGDSLRSGAVAYRSYAAWRVDHPIAPAFDLCSSACCQVNDPDTATSTDAAVAATAGLLLERSGAAFASEYSAENNAWDDPDDGLLCSNADLSCGDGAVGSPALGWPCLDDAVAAGHGCFGHGRGLSQWGSMRWGRDFGWTWRRILDHYYNADGSPAGLRSATLASPVRIDGGDACPARVGAGDRFRLHLDATNLAALPHPAVRFGASVVAPGGEWISDPDDDAPAPLEPGAANRESRGFDLPADVAAGLYDVALALWLDVDGDGAVTSADLRLDLEVFDAALAVAPGVDLLFADCFESADLGGWSGGSQ